MHKTSASIVITFLMTLSMSQAYGTPIDDRVNGRETVVFDTPTYQGHKFLALSTDERVLFHKDDFHAHALIAKRAENICKLMGFSKALSSGSAPFSKEEWLGKQWQVGAYENPWVKKDKGEIMDTFILADFPSDSGNPSRYIDHLTCLK